MFWKICIFFCLFIFAFHTIMIQSLPLLAERQKLICVVAAAAAVVMRTVTDAVAVERHQTWNSGSGACTADPTLP